MNEILVEEENTVYELDPECLRHKEEQRQLEEKRPIEMPSLATIVAVLLNVRFPAVDA